MFNPGDEVTVLIDGIDKPFNATVMGLFPNPNVSNGEYMVMDENGGVYEVYSAELTRRND